MQRIAISAVRKINSQLSETYRETHTTRDLRRARENILDRWQLCYAEDTTEFHRREDCFEYNNKWYTTDIGITCASCSDQVPDTRACELHIRGRSYTQLVCSNCYDSLDPWECQTCEQMFENNYPSYEDDCGELHCRHCQESEGLGGVDVPTYHSAYRHSIPDRRMPSYSMEWEMVVEKRKNMLSELKKANIQMLTWETDGSLPRDRGIELLLQHRRDLNMLWHDACDIINVIEGHAYGIRAWSYRDNDGAAGAGIHINCNRHAAWDRIKLMRLCYIVAKCKRQLVQIAGRESERWAIFPNPERFMLSNWINGYYGKYLALRIGTDRMEWRMFRSSVNPDRIKLYCQTIKIAEDLALDTSVRSANLKTYATMRFKHLIETSTVINSNK